jgi:peptide/nickel transport system substrate-binding protein
MKHVRTGGGVAAAAIGAALLALTGCGSDSGGSSGSKLARDGSVTIALQSDPGSLDPQRSVSGDNQLLGSFAYDTPVKLQDSGEVSPSVVTRWQAGDKSYVLTVRRGVTCADGSPLDARVVAENVNWVADPRNESPMAGVKVPVGARATADAGAGTVTVRLTDDAPFFMQNLAELPLVCARGLADRGTLKKATAGSGPYVLKNAVPGDHYDFTLREGYRWGPDGASTDAEGMPASVTFRVVTSPTTTANLLLNGQLNVATLSGADTTRLRAAGLYTAGGQFIGQEIAFNDSDEAVADPEVRRALISALNLPDLAKVDSGGLGEQANGLIADPKICSGDTMRGFTPAYDPEGAARALEGKRVAITFVYPNEDATTAASAEYIADAWRRLGVDVRLNEQSFDQTSAVVFGKGDWTVTLIGLGVNNPETLVPFMSGPSPTEGNNFGHFDNKQYDALVARARTKPGTEGCADWNAAESALFRDADITPISTKPFLYYGRGARFEVPAHIFAPTSLRALEG